MSTFVYIMYGLPSLVIKLLEGCLAWSEEVESAFRLLLVHLWMYTTSHHQL
jgi:hypothetical protein